MSSFSAAVSAFSVYQQSLFYLFLDHLVLLYCSSYISFFLCLLFFALMYSVGLTYPAFFYFSVTASHVVFLFYSSFLVSIKNNLCCINIKFTIGFPFFLHNVRYSFCHIRKFNWMLQLNVVPYVFILHFKAINIFLIFHFCVGCI